MIRTESEYLSWDFDREDTLKYTNCFHKYPAMIVPQIVNRLLAEYSVPNGIFLDPFCGTGRSLVSASLYQMQCLGLDINPLAVLISNVKLSVLDPFKLNNYLAMVNDVYLNTKVKCSSLPDFFNRSYWFSQETSLQIYRMMRAIRKVFPRNCNYKDFFYVVLSETIRDVSWTRNSEFKLYRIPSQSLPSYNKNTLSLFIQKAKRNIKGMESFIEALYNRTPDFKIFMSDCKCLLKNEALATLMRNRKIDLIITSPPYGDSRTTVDYGNFSRLSLQWLRTDSHFSKRWSFFDEVSIRSINNHCLGGLVQTNESVLPSDNLQRVINEIVALDSARARYVKQFFRDLHSCIYVLTRCLGDEGHMCFVIANRTVKGVEIPMDAIIEDFAAEYGFGVIRKIERNIYGKKLPRKINTNSSNVKTAPTMLREFVIVAKKA